MQKKKKKYKWRFEENRHENSEVIDMGSSKVTEWHSEATFQHSNKFIIKALIFIYKEMVHDKSWWYPLFKMIIFFIVILLINEIWIFIIMVTEWRKMDMHIWAENILLKLCEIQTAITILSYWLDSMLF